jgi:hypothetical protein
VTHARQAHNFAAWGDLGKRAEDPLRPGEKEICPERGRGPSATRGKRNLPRILNSWRSVGHNGLKSPRHIQPWYKTTRDMIWVSIWRIRGNTTGGNGWVVTRIKALGKGIFQGGLRPKPRTSWGAMGGSLDKSSPKSFTPPWDCRGGNLGKGGVDPQRGETEKLRLPPGLQRRNFNAGKHKAFHRVKVTIPEHRAG